MSLSLNQFCIIKSNSICIDFETNINFISESHAYLDNTINPAFIKQFMEATEFTLRAGDRKFKCKKVNSDGVNIIFPLEDEQNYTNTREATRTVIPPETNLYIKFLNPIDKVTILKKKICDISTIGLAFHTPEKNKLFTKLRDLKSIQIEYNGKCIYEGEGNTLHTREVYTKDGIEKCLIGIRFLPPIDDDTLAKITTGIK